MNRTSNERVRLWSSRLLLYIILSVFAFLMLFPLTYMVIASLKTTQDFSGNPRRLLPYSPVEETYGDQSLPLYSFEINGESQDVVISGDDKINFGYFTTQASLQRAVNQGQHAQTRRNAAVSLIAPLEYIAEDGSKVDLEEIPISLASSGDRVQIANSEGDKSDFVEYEVLLDGQPLATLLEATTTSVPLVAYSTSDLRDDGNAGFVLTFTDEVTLMDGEGRERDYPRYQLTVGDTSRELVLAFNSKINVFFAPGQTKTVVYAVDRTADPVEIVEFQFANYDLVLGRTDDKNFQLDRALINTAFVTILVTVGQIITSLFGGYAFSRIPFKGRDAIFMMYLGSIMIPFVVLIVPIYRLMTVLGWENHLVALVVPWIFTAYGTFLMRQFFMQIPAEIEEAALLDGCSRLRILWSIFIPLTRPAIATQAVFSFLYAWNSFLWPLIIINTGNKDDHVLTLALITLSNINADKPNLIMTGAAVMILPPIIVFIFAQRYFIEGIASSGLKG